MEVQIIISGEVTNYFLRASSSAKLLVAGCGGSIKLYKYPALRSIGS